MTRSPGSEPPLISRRTVLIAASTVTAGAALPLAGPPSVAGARPPGPETFDAMPTGAPPSGATVTGTATVEAAPFGGRRNRAVHLTDTSTTGQTVVTFPADPAPVRRFTVDLSLEQVTQSVFVALQGTGANPALGIWRFQITPAYGKNVDGLVSVYDGTAWSRLSVISDLTERGRVSQLTIDATTSAAVLTVGDFSFRTTARASAGTDITGISFASSGTAPTGSNAWIDNLAMSVPASTPAVTGDGAVATGVITRYTSGKAREWTRVAGIDLAGADARHLSARVHVGGDWTKGRIVTGEDGAPAVLARLSDADIGEHPVTVTITDRRGGTVLSAQGRAQSLAPYPPTVVARETAPQQPRFPDALTLADGTILVVYHSATAHAKANGRIVMVRSSDHGATWSAPAVVWDTPGADDRDPKLAQLADGTVLLTTFRTDWAAGGQNLGTFVHRSTDGGLTFAEAVAIESARASGAWEHGPALQLPSGDVLQPLYGDGARVARSTDGGRTFPASAELMIALDTPTRAYLEPNIVRLPSGELIMSIRVADREWGQETRMMLSRSHDDGRTWSALEETDYPASSHHTLVLPDGAVLLTYGDQWQDARPTYAVRIRKPSRAWTRDDAVGILNAGWHDQANPSSVVLPDGRAMTFGFDVVERTLLAVTYRI